MLIDLAASAAAITALIAKHPLLPARDLVPSKTGIKVNLHEGLGDFEAWREALSVPVDDIDFAVSSHNTVLRIDTVFAGVRLEIVGYSDPIAADARPLKAVA